MKTFESFVVFIITMLGMILAASGNKHQQFYKRMLDLHNEYRNKHGSQPLSLDENMSNEAMRLALNRFYNEDDIRKNNWPYGDNVYTLVSPNEPTADRVFFTWYNKGENYDYSKEPPVGTNKDFFTQIVWKDTKSLGLALIQYNNSNIVVAIYHPPGNIKNQYMLNVINPEL